MAEVAYDKFTVAVTGLPLAGCSLMCQLLGHHPRIFSPSHGSPLCGALCRLRRYFSDHPYIVGLQSGRGIDLTDQQMVNAFRGFLRGWFALTPKPVVVDKNPEWLQMIETLHHIDPEFRMIVCIRDLRQILGAVESRHRRTPLFDFPEHPPAYSTRTRADALFGADGAIGKPLLALRDLLDIHGRLKQQICYVTFEALVTRPVKTMETIYQWLALPHAPFDPENLPVPDHGTSGGFRFKIQHRIGPRIRPPAIYTLPPTVAQRISDEFQWYFDEFYPGPSGPSASANDPGRGFPSACGSLNGSAGPKPIRRDRNGNKQNRGDEHGD